MPSPILGITEINQAQASKYLTANEAFRRLEQGAQHFVAIDRDLTVPPGTPADGDAYIIASGPTGLWAGHADEIAYYLNGVWKFITPREWMTASLLDEDVTVRWDGAAWVTAYAAYHQNNFTAVTDPGVNDDSSAGYSVGSKWLNTVTTEVFLCLDANVGAAHWESATLTIDELGAAAAAGTKRSIEIDSGDLQLAGDEDAPGANKVYGTDGSGNRGWKADPAAGTSGREALTANRSYYVRNDGSDSNDGLSDTAGGAFLTIQKAIDTATALDFSTYDITINIDDGTYAENVEIKSYVGSGTLYLVGNTATPANVKIIPVSGVCFSGYIIATKYDLRGFMVESTSGGYGFSLSGSALVYIGKIDFGECTTAHIRLSATISMYVDDDYTISGDASNHWYTAFHCSITPLPGNTITLTGIPNFSNAFAKADRGGVLSVNNASFSGTATGTRYSVDSNAVIYTAGGGASFLPGDSGGSSTNGGVYI